MPPLPPQLRASLLFRPAEESRIIEPNVPKLTDRSLARALQSSPPPPLPQIFSVLALLAFHNTAAEAGSDLGGAQRALPFRRGATSQIIIFVDTFRPCYNLHCAFSF
jgi:hypothetical protein